MIIVRRDQDISVLPMAKKTRALLRSWGIGTVGALFDADEEQLKDLGQALRLARQLARGDQELGLLEWGVALAGRSGKLWWSLNNGVLTVWGRGRMANYTAEKLPPWQPFAHEIRQVRVEEQVENVGARAFSGCPALTRVILGEAVARVGWEAFRDCAALTTVDTPRKTVNWRTQDREGVRPDRLLIGTRAFAGTPWQRQQSGDFCIRDGVLMEYFGDAEEVVIPEGVTSIAPMVFEGLPIRQVTLPRTLEHIGQFAFRGTRLQQVELPRSVKTVDSWAFAQIVELGYVLVRGGGTKAAPDAFAQTPVAADTPVKGRWKCLNGLDAEPVPGIDRWQRLIYREDPHTGMGRRYFCARNEFRKRLKQGQMLLRLCPDRENRRVEFVQAFARDPEYGWFTQLVYPCLDNEGRPGIWRDSTTWLDGGDIARCDLSGMREEGKFEWYTLPYEPMAEYDMPLCLLLDWLKLHPDHTLDSIEENIEKDRYRIFVPC